MMAISKKLIPKEQFFHKNIQGTGKGLQMMTYSAGSSCSYKCDVVRARMINGFCKQLHIHTVQAFSNELEFRQKFRLFYVPRRGA